MTCEHEIVEYLLVTVHLQHRLYSQQIFHVHNYTSQLALVHRTRERPSHRQTDRQRETESAVERLVSHSHELHVGLGQLKRPLYDVRRQLRYTLATDRNVQPANQSHTTLPANHTQRCISRLQTSAT